MFDMSLQVQKKQQIRSLLQEKLKDYKDTGGQEVKPRNDRTKETKSQQESTVAPKNRSDDLDDNEIETNIEEDSESQNEDVAKECKVIHQPKNVAMETAKPSVEGRKTGKEDEGKSKNDRNMKSEVRSPGKGKNIFVSSLMQNVFLETLCCMLQAIVATFPKGW